MQPQLPYYEERRALLSDYQQDARYPLPGLPMEQVHGVTRVCWVLGDGSRVFHFTFWSRRTLIPTGSDHPPS